MLSGHDTLRHFFLIHSWFFHLPTFLYLTYSPRTKSFF
nr:MAG TPA: hypothetical protein [Caudoviricetes sp.]